MKHVEEEKKNPNERYRKWEGSAGHSSECAYEPIQANLIRWMKKLIA